MSTLDNIDELYTFYLWIDLYRDSRHPRAFAHCNETSQNPTCVAIASKNDEDSAHARQTLFVGGGQRGWILGAGRRGL